MKRFLLFNLIIVLMIGFIGCAFTNNFSHGRDFDTTKVKEIIKGKATQQEVLNIFGAPFIKTVVSANEEKWMYTYYSGQACAQSYVVTVKSEVTGTMKTLDILFKDSIVSNYSYNEGPMLGSMNMK